jgi:membrane-associated phospholipid phosphatase
MISQHGKAQCGIGWEGWSRATAADRWTLGYALAIAVVLVCRVPTVYLPVVLVVHGLLVALALLMPRARRAGTVGRFVGDWYPLLILTALYTEIGLANLADGRAYDRIVLGWEQALFGFQPAREWIRSRPSVWLSWVLHLGYLAYYAIIVAAPLALWLTRQREAMQRAVTTITATFYLCYATYLVFPVVGPRHVFPAADNAATQTAIAQWTARFLEHVSAWGAAFPSSHVAVAVAATAVALLEWRVLGLALVVPTPLLTLGSVYGQFHYAVDALAGIGVGLAVAAGAWLVSRKGATALEVDPGPCMTRQPPMPPVDRRNSFPT